jgi:uncharacterized protein YkwD
MQGAEDRRRDTVRQGGRLGQSLVVVVAVGVLLVLGGCAGMGSTERALFEAPPLPETVTAEAPALDASALERAIHRRVNAIRATHGVPRLAWSDQVALVARAHSRDMAQRRYVGHTSPSGETPFDRAQQAGVGGTQVVGSMAVSGMAENLYATHRFAEYTVTGSDGGPRSYDVVWKRQPDLVREAVAAWMGSPGHKANLLSPLYDAQAVGVVLGDDNTVFVTQNFVVAKDRSVLADLERRSE